MSISLIIAIALILGVVFVNGWTDAPNAIATAISTRVLRPRFAITLAVFFNFLGVLVMTFFNASVAETISNMVDFGGGSGGNSEALTALCAAMFAIVIWATAAWYFGIPTSESHALIAGVTGAAIAMGGLSSVNMSEWVKVIWGLVISSAAGYLCGYGVTKIIEAICRNVNRRKADRFFAKGQAAAACTMAFLHGAQDGQKFMGVFMLGLYLNGMVQRNAAGGFDIPVWVMALCSLVMGFGTSIGGWRIIKSVGMDMVKLEKYQGFAADLAAGGCLLASSLTGIPVSTTHTKTTAIMGVGSAKRFSNVNWSVALEMVYAWVLTFPGCGLIGYIMAKVFLRIF